jgi:hypothetical protein
MAERRSVFQSLDGKLSFEFADRDLSSENFVDAAFVAITHAG